MNAKGEARSVLRVVFLLTSLNPRKNTIDKITPSMQLLIHNGLVVLHDFVCVQVFSMVITMFQALL